MVPWKLWTALPTVKLWEAVALLMGLNPGSMKQERNAWMGGPGSSGPIFAKSSFPNSEVQAQFDQALNFAERATSAQHGPIYLRTGLHVGMNKRTAQVSLAEVVAFFRGGDWQGIPAPLLELADHPAQPTIGSSPARPENTALENADAHDADAATGDQSRRLNALKKLGGSVVMKADGEWSVTGINELVQQEREAGKPRSHPKTIRADLIAAAEAEREAKRSGEAASGMGIFGGLGARKRQF